MCKTSSPAKPVTWGGGPMQISQVGAVVLIQHVVVSDDWLFHNV